MEKQIIPVPEKTGRIKPSIQPTGVKVEIEYVENLMTFHEEKATGEIEGQKFSIHNGMNGDLWVQFEKMKGSIPKLRIKSKDLIEAAYNIAKDNNLFTP